MNNYPRRADCRQRGGLEGNMRAKMEQLPAKNPNPVLSAGKDGTVLYSNEAGEPLLHEWDVREGDKLPPYIGNLVQRVISCNIPEKIEVEAGKRAYSLTFHLLPEDECVNIYGFDISDQKELEGKLRIKEKQNGILHKIGKIALGQESFQTFMDESVRLIASTLELEYCKIMELMPDGKFLLRAGIGWKPEFVGKNTVEGEKEPQAEYTLLSRMPVIVENYDKENRFEKPEVLEVHGVASGASVVIGSMEKIFGVLTVNSTKKRKFTSDDTYFLTSVAFLISQVVERKKAEEALKKAYDNLEKIIEERTIQLERAYKSSLESEQYLAEAQRMTHIGNWDWNIVANKMYRSDEMYRIFGLSPQEFSINYGVLLKYIHPEDRVDLDNAIIDTLNGNPFDNDYRIILANREERIVHISGEVIFDEKNRPVRLRGIVQDITELKKSEEKTRRLANIVESSNEAIGTMSLDGVITTWNRGAEQIYGYSAKEILGKSGSVLTPSSLCQEPKKLIEMVKQGKEIRQYETYRLRKDGKLIEVSLNLSPVYDASGKLTDISVIASDITERERAEEKLRASEKKYRDIVETANEGICLINGEAIITYINKKLADMLGYGPEEVIGRPALDLFEKGNKSIVKAYMERRRRGENESYELKLIRKDGSPLWVLISARSDFDSGGKFMGSLSMLTDITKRKEAEEALANMEVVRKKEIHHRIKNNLQVISSLIDLQAEKFKGRRNIKDLEVLDSFRESQDRVTSIALIHEGLYKGGGIDKLDFSSYIKELAENLFLTYRVGDTDISLNMDLAENTFFDIDTAIPLGIIINELVSNSFKYAFKGRDKGEIRIRLSKGEDRECEKEGRSTNFSLTVSDDGIGIPENLAIENLDSLGLQLVISLVEQLDGEFELKRNNGTEFTILFTIIEKDNQAPVPAL